MTLIEEVLLATAIGFVVTSLVGVYRIVGPRTMR